VESINTFWLVVVAAFAGGCAVGALVFGTMSRGTKDAKKLKAELEEKEQELQAYKSGVASHFNKTSELVNELTQDYVKVYQHLSEGARTLGEPRDGMDLLEQQPGRVLINVPEASGEPEAADASIRNDGPSTASKDPGDDEPKVVDDASREYISETIKEAAGIADTLDKKVEPAPGGTDTSSRSPSPQPSPKGRGS